MFFDSGRTAKLGSGEFSIQTRKKEITVEGRWTFLKYHSQRRRVKNVIGRTTEERVF